MSKNRGCSCGHMLFDSCMQMSEGRANIFFTANSAFQGIHYLGLEANFVVLNWTIH
jgi:hypothetical protein